MVEAVGSDSVVAGYRVAVWFGLDGGVVGVFGGVAAEGSVGPFGVVGVLEFVELVWAGVWFGLVWGFRERGSRPSSPCCSYRVTRVCTRCQDTSYLRATSALLRPC